VQLLLVAEIGEVALVVAERGGFGHRVFLRSRGTTGRSWARR
jgi:hypothetical protein